MKSIKTFGMSLMTLWIGCCLTACDEDKNETAEPETIFGEWVSEKAEANDLITDGSTSCLFHLRFLEDGTYYGSRTIEGNSYKYVRPTTGISSLTALNKYTWKEEQQGIITATDGNSIFDHPYSIKEGVLTYGTVRYIRPEKSKYSWMPHFLMDAIPDEGVHDGTSETLVKPNTEVALKVWNVQEGKEYTITDASLILRYSDEHSDTIHIEPKFDKDGIYTHRVKMGEDWRMCTAFFSATYRLNGKVMDEPEPDDLVKEHKVLESIQFFNADNR